MNLKISPVATLQGAMRPPSDKSLTHRGYMFAAIANGQSVVRNPLQSEDCAATLRCLQQMGLSATWLSDNEVVLTPFHPWKSPTEPLDCGNSGTTIRILSGLVASRGVEATLTGDASLCSRPMGRIATPLRLMGAEFEGDKPPVHIKGVSRTKAISYQSPVASAQVKSCILLAGLTADGETVVTEPSPSRDHTERMLRAMGVEITSTWIGETNQVRLTPPQHLEPFHLDVPGDISSAAFFMVAAAILPDGMLTLEGLSVNPTRTGILDVFKQTGVETVVYNEQVQLGEPTANVDIRSGKQDLHPFTIEGGLVPRLIDEIPVLAVLATQCRGRTHVKDSAEMRIKESDRIELMVNGLRAMGAAIEARPDGFIVDGPCELKGVEIDCHGDHRIAMAFAVAGLIATGDTVIQGAECIATSFPTFESELQRLCIV